MPVIGASPGGFVGSSHGTSSLSHPSAALTFIDQSTASGSVSIGTAAADRIVVVVIASYDDTSAPEVSSVTIGGVGATMTQISNGRRSVTIAWRKVPTGSSATVSGTMASNCRFICVDVYAVYGCSDIASTYGNTRTSTGTTTSVTGVYADTNAVVVAGIVVFNDATVSWSSQVTEYTDTEVATGFNDRYSMAAEVQASALSNATITCTHGSADSAAIAAAVFY